LAVSTFSTRWIMDKLELGRFNCPVVCVLVLVGPFASQSAACQDVSSFVRWTNRACMCVCVCPCWSLSVLLLVRMTHPLSAACQDVSSFVRWTNRACMCVYVSLLVLVGPFASQDDLSFVSSLSRCLIFCQVDQSCVYVCVCVFVGPCRSFC